MSSSTKKTLTTRRPSVETIPAFARHDLTDAEWAALEPLLPVGKKPGCPPIHAKRRLIDGIRWRVRAGVPWRMCRHGTGRGSECTGSFVAGSSTGCGARSSRRSRLGRMLPS
ncbi:transposase [Actinospica robiniae]|uniref:transposase n=1 Tax=Actinospica robiniae TaxID=304901 RepID=UPI000A017952